MVKPVQKLVNSIPILLQIYKFYHMGIPCGHPKKKNKTEKSIYNKNIWSKCITQKNKAKEQIWEAIT